MQGIPDGFKKGNRREQTAVRKLERISRPDWEELVSLTEAAGASLGPDHLPRTGNGDRTACWRWRRAIWDGAWEVVGRIRARATARRPREFGSLETAFGRLEGRPSGALISRTSKCRSDRIGNFP